MRMLVFGMQIELVHFEDKCWAFQDQVVTQRSARRALASKHHLDESDWDPFFRRMRPGSAAPDDSLAEAASAAQCDDPFCAHWILGSQAHAGNERLEQYIRGCGVTKRSRWRDANHRRCRRIARRWVLKAARSSVRQRLDASARVIQVHWHRYCNEIRPRLLSERFVSLCQSSAVTLQTRIRGWLCRKRFRLLRVALCGKVAVGGRRLESSASLLRSHAAAIIQRRYRLYRAGSRFGITVHVLLMCFRFMNRLKRAALRSRVRRRNVRAFVVGSLLHSFAAWTVDWRHRRLLVWEEVCPTPRKLVQLDAVAGDPRTSQCWCWHHIRTEIMASARHSALQVAGQARWSTGMVAKAQASNRKAGSACKVQLPRSAPWRCRCCLRVARDSMPRDRQVVFDSGLIWSCA
mmetsp:Transcript_789/g.1847  ORF Transcript_789/g.1847 Transcript_789/m.1847 type:complete len:405 (+) Transcript_789:633-1847(+)